MKRNTFFILTLCFVFLAPPLLLAGTQPIANLPHYNGTPWGTPNTGGDCDALAADCDSLAGRRMFTTLYRDNYNRTSGCAGEGCGSHAGVDIAVPAGTPVRAALGGKIIEAECKEGAGSGNFGGTIVIEATNPYATGKVYLVYAHLDDWNDHAVGATVTQGEVIGLSGGASGGVCPGASTGAHFHFQVDKNPPDANGRPWFPSSTETADTNFEVTEHTHNPLPFVLGFAYNFTFAEDNFKELWGGANVNDFNTDASALWIDSESTSPYVGRSSFFGNASSCGASAPSAPCSRTITLDADVFKTLKVTLDFECFTNPAKFFFKGEDDVWRGGSFSYSEPARYILNVGGLTGWNGIITDFIVEPSQGCTAIPGPEEYFVKQLYFLP